MSLRTNSTVTISLVRGIVTLALKDIVDGVPLYDKTNQGKELENRINPTHFDIRRDPLVGDKNAMRAIYTNARWLLDHHDKEIIENPEQTPEQQAFDNLDNP